MSDDDPYDDDPNAATRSTIVSTAHSLIGTVHAKQPGEADETGRHVRHLLSDHRRGERRDMADGRRHHRCWRHSADPRPQTGDVGYLDAHQHHCVIAGVDGDTIASVDGNSGTDSEIIDHTRSKSEFAGFFTAFP
jgi:hypothetical protein